MTTTERDAANAAARITREIRSGRIFTIKVEWVKGSQTTQRRIRIDGVKVASTTGGGYDKTSAVLADFLRHLGRTPAERQAIQDTSGAGVAAVIRAMEDCGYTLESVHEDPDCTIYAIGRK